MTRFNMTPAARIRRFYWKRIRRYRYEICGRPRHIYAPIRLGCGRPVEVVWGTSSGVWNYVIADQDKTVYAVREGTFGGPVKERAEGAGGVLCLKCFDRFARDKGIYFRWESKEL